MALKTFLKGPGLEVWGEAWGQGVWGPGPEASFFVLCNFSQFWSPGHGVWGEA